MSSTQKPAPSGIAVAPDVTQIAFRLETATDDAWITRLHEKCFGPGRFARAAFRVREILPAEPELGFCAELDGHPVASVRMTPISLNAGNGYLLGPLATDPHFRNKGAGRALVTHVTARAMARPGCGFVLLVGDADYYEKLLFLPVRERVIFPGPVDPSRILVHCSPGLLEHLGGKIAPWRSPQT
ncbi:MAG: N-acetyltransferase [Alphaproteobacteria bacterium]|nr:N-acetyltransferase [Alphaproteobacteria bacterium]